MRSFFQKLEGAITTVSFYMKSRKRFGELTSVPILAYHEICDLPREISRLHSYNVTPSAFREQMDFLYENNYSVIKLEEFISCLTKKEEMPHKSVTITFDDGYKNNYTNALPILRQYNFPATVFLATDYIGSNDIFPWLDGLVGHDRDVRESFMPMAWDEVVEMSQDNIAFGSHTCSHSNIRLISENVFEEEIKRSKSIIENKINKNVELFSYPFSFPKYRKTYQHIVDATKDTLQNNGFLGACTTIIGTNSLETDPFCLKRIQIKNTDNLFNFKAKIEGTYNWAGSAQKIYQKFLEPFVEQRSH